MNIVSKFRTTAIALVASVLLTCFGAGLAIAQEQHSPPKISLKDIACICEDMLTCCQGAVPSESSPIGVMIMACVIRKFETCSAAMYACNTVGCCDCIPDALKYTKRACKKCDAIDCPTK